MKQLELIKIAVSLAASNFIFQAFTHHDYLVAAERSYFQTIAIVLVGIVGAFTSDKRSGK